MAEVDCGRNLANKFWHGTGHNEVMNISPKISSQEIISPQKIHPINWINPLFVLTTTMLFHSNQHQKIDSLSALPIDLFLIELAQKGFGIRRHAISISFWNNFIKWDIIAFNEILSRWCTIDPNFFDCENVAVESESHFSKLSIFTNSVTRVLSRKCTLTPIYTD